MTYQICYRKNNERKVKQTVKLYTGVEKTINQSKILTKAEWQKMAEKLYGTDTKHWRFKCPICGHTASVQEIIDAGAKDPNCAYMECIGRYRNNIGCNFAAYGFLGIPCGGYVIKDKNGIGIEIFEFADEVKTN